MKNPHGIKVGQTLWFVPRVVDREAYERANATNKAWQLLKQMS